MTEQIKECQMCHEVFPRDSFYKRKNRAGEYTWTISYCKSCNHTRLNNLKNQNPDHYKEYNKNQNYSYYRENTTKIKINQKRYYYDKLPQDKKLQYKQKIQKNFPKLFDQIFIS